MSVALPKVDLIFLIYSFIISCWTSTSSFFFVTLFKSWRVISFYRESYYMSRDNFFSDPFTSINLFLTALRSSSNFLTLSFRILCWFFISVFFLEASSTSFCKSFFYSNVLSPLALATFLSISWIWYSAL